MVRYSIETMQFFLQNWSYAYLAGQYNSTHCRSFSVGSMRAFNEHKYVEEYNHLVPQICRAFWSTSDAPYNN
jgi:hypothetical protein